LKYSLVYTQRAVKDIQGLEEKIKNRIAKTLLKYSEDPFKHSEKLTNSRLGNYRFRIGDSRVMLDLEEYDISVLRVGNRKDIYRKF